MRLHREILEGLAKVGYKTNDGIDGAGHLSLLVARGGGYYFGALYSLALYISTLTSRSSTDVGACQKIIDGKIKVKNGTDVESFTSKGLKFKDGSEMDADVVLFATG